MDNLLFLHLAQRTSKAFIKGLECRNVRTSEKSKVVKNEIFSVRGLKWMIQLPKVKIPIKVGESEVTKPGLGRKMTACCPSSSSGWGNVIPSMFSLGKMFANCFRRRSFSSDWKISFLWECNRRAYGQLLFQSSLHLQPSNSIYWKCKWKLNFQLSASEAIEAMKILYLRGKFPYAKFQPPILKTVDLLEELTYRRGEILK